MESNIKTKKYILTGLFAALTAIGAYIYLPLPVSPVPITLQMFFTFMAGGILGKRYGFLSQLIYLMLGAVGLPVFAGGLGGIGVLFGPTGGYIFGFLLAGYISGYGKNIFLQKVLFMFSGLLTIYLLGITVLMLNTKITFLNALSVGVLPFLIGDFIKISLAAYLSVKLSNYI